MSIHSAIASTPDNLNNAKAGVSAQHASMHPSDEQQAASRACQPKSCTPRTEEQPLSMLGAVACCDDTTLADATRNNPQRKHALATEQAGDEQAVTILANSSAAILGNLVGADTCALKKAGAALSQTVEGAEEPAVVRASSLHSARALEPGTPAQSLEPITKKSLGSLGLPVPEDGGRAVPRLETVHSAPPALDAVPAHVAALSNSQDNGAAAAWAIAGLAMVCPGMGNAVWEASGIAPLVGMLSSPDHVAAAAAASAIAQLAGGGNTTVQIGVAEAGGLQALLALAKSGWPDAAGAAAAALAALTEDSAALQEALLDTGGAQALGELLGAPCRAVRDRAAAILLMLAGKKSAVYQAVCQAGGLPHLVSMARRRALPSAGAAAAPDGASPGSEQDDDCCAVELVAGMAAHKRTHKQLRQAGGVKLLVEMLDGAPAAQKHAAWALQCLAGASDDMEEAVCEAGGIPALLKLLAAVTQQLQQDGGRPKDAAEPPSPELLHPVVVALVNLAAGDPCNRDAIRKAGGIPILVPLLMHGPIAGHAARALWNVICRNAPNQDAARDAGTVPLLLSLLRSPLPSKGSQAGAPSPHVEAAGALCALTAHNSRSQDALRAVKAMPLLLQLLVEADAHALKEQAAWALQALTAGSPGAQAELARAGGVPRLLALLAFPEAWNWTPVARTLRNVAAGGRSLQEKLAAAGAVPVMVDLLTYGRPALQVCAAETLGSLAGQYRVDVVDANGIKKLRELASESAAAPQAVRTAAQQALAIAGPGPTFERHRNSRGSTNTSAAPEGRLRCAARETLNSHKWFIGLLRPKPSRSGNDRSAA